MEIDISMCDSSVGTGVFNYVGHQLLQLGVPEEEVRGILGQCTKPFRMRNPENPSEYFLGKFYGYYLVSGTVLTTFADTWASLLIASSVLGCFEEGQPHVARIEDRVAELGFVVTVEERAHFSGLTFMKRFACPTLDGGIAAPQCLGAIARGLGKVVPELNETVVPKSKGTTLEYRAGYYLGAVMEGWKNEPKHSFVESLREAFPFYGSVDPRFLEQSRRQYTTPQTGELDVFGICARYGLERWEFESFCSVVAGMQVGSRLFSSVLTRIYTVDYGPPV